MKGGGGRARALRVGLVASEVFDLRQGNLGGFGKAAAEFSRLTARRPDLGWECLWILPRAAGGGVGGDGMIHGSPAVRRDASPTKFVAALRRARPDLLLLVDLQAIYRIPFWALPRTPVIVWVRDPWSPADKRVLATLRVPGQPGVRPQGLMARDLRSFRRDALVARALGRRVAWAVPARFLSPKIPQTYGGDPASVHLLPNFALRGDAGGQARAPRPTVLFMGRLDPVKRPWIAVEVARRMPEVDFVMVGTSHLRGPGAWVSPGPETAPRNVRRVDAALGPDQARAYAAAWVLLNSSIHEGLPLTFQEALAHGLPVVAALDPERVVSRFGRFVGEEPGDGMAAVPRFVAALAELLGDREQRETLGSRGRAWVEATHNETAFVESFRRICRELGLPA